MIHCGEQGHVLVFSLMALFGGSMAMCFPLPTTMVTLHPFSYAMHIVNIFLQHFHLDFILRC